MTITLDDELYKMLQTQAAREGRDTDTVARELLAASLTDAARDFSEAVEGIRRGFEDFEAGRYRTLAEVRAEKKAKYGIGS